MNEQEQQKKSRRWPLIIFALVALVGAGAAGIFALRNFTEASQASAEAMPPTTLFYGSLDIIGLLDPTTLRQFGDVFDESLEDADIVAGSPEDVYGNLDSILETYNVEFEADIQSWIGRSVGVGVLAIEATLDGPVPTEYVIAAEIRNEDEAEQFLERFSAENNTSDASYERVDYLIENSLSGGTLVIGRSDSLMLWASSSSAMEQAIDAQVGDSLFDAAEYNDVLAKLPEQRAITLLVMEAGYNELEQIAVADPDVGLALGGTLINAEQLTDLGDSLGLGSMKTGAMAFNIAPTGFEIEFATVIDAESLTKVQLAAINNINLYSGELAGSVPDSTILYLGAPGIGHSWERITALVNSGVNPEDFEDALTLADQTLGFSVEGDLMPQLTGDLALALFSDANSPLAPVLGADVGLMLVHDVADSAEMSAISNQLAQSLTEQGFQALDNNGITSVNFVGTPVASFGVSDNSFAIGTNPALVSALGDGAALGDRELFTQAQALLPETMKLTLFADVTGAIEAANLPPEQLEQALQFASRIPAVVMGMQSDETGGTAKLIVMTTGN